MEEVNIEFLGKKYIFPKELIIYVKYLNQFKPYYERALEPLISQMGNKEYSSGDEEDFKYYRNPLKLIVEDVIRDLSNEGIYNVSIKELLDDNEGYKSLWKTCDECFQTIKSIYIKGMEDYISGYESELNKANNKVTGLDYSILTNSFSSLLAYNVLDSIAANKQMKQADKEYRTRMNELSNQYDNETDRQEATYLVSTYYPRVSEALSNFVAEICNKYITMVFNKNNYDFTTVSKYDLEKSCNLLENLSLVENKIEVIRQSFEICPFNSDVYESAIENGYIDNNVLEVGNIFGLKEQIIERLKEYCIKNKNKKSNVEEIAKFLSLYTGEELNDIYEKDDKVEDNVSLSLQESSDSSEMEQINESECDEEIEDSDYKDLSVEENISNEDSSQDVNIKKRKSDLLLFLLIVIAISIVVAFFISNKVGDSQTYDEPYDEEIISCLEEEYGYGFEEYDEKETLSRNKRIKKYEDKYIEDDELNKQFKQFIKGCDLQKKSNKSDLTDDSDWNKGVIYKLNALTNLTSNDLIAMDNDVIEAMVQLSISLQTYENYSNWKDLEIDNEDGKHGYIVLKLTNNTGYLIEEANFGMVMNGGDEINQEVHNWKVGKRKKIIFDIGPTSDDISGNDVELSIFLNDLSIYNEDDEADVYYDDDEEEDLNSISHYCDVGGCLNEGTHAIQGISGLTEYYCTEHYNEMKETIDDLYNS